MVRRGDEEVLDEVVVLEVHALHPLAAALLLAVGGDGQALHVSRAGDRDDHVLLGDEVLDIEVPALGREGGLALGGELLPDFSELVLDDLQDESHVGEEFVVPDDLLAQFGELSLDLRALEAGEPAETHLEDGVGLDDGEPEALHERRARLVVVCGRPDDADDLVDVVERDDQSLEDVGPLLGLAQLVARATHDDVLLVLDVVEEHLLEGEGPRHVVDQREHVDAEAGLELRVLVELVENDLGDRVVLQLDDDSHTLAVRLVSQVRDLSELLLTHEIRDLHDQLRLVHLVRDLADDDSRSACRGLLDMGLSANRERPAPGLVCVLDTFAAHDLRSGREVRSGENGHEFVDRAVGVIYEHDNGVDDLAEVVRGDVRRHTDRDSGAPVDQEVRVARREDERLLERLVVVGTEVDRLLVEVAEELHRDLLEAGLCVSHGRRGVAVDRSEVSVAVDQGHPHREVLSHADHRVVDSDVAVRMVLADDFTDGPRGLLERPAGGEARLVHRVEDAAVDRLQPVADVGKCARDDNAHRVCEERCAHLLVELDREKGRSARVYAGCIFCHVGHSLLC